MAGKPHEGRKKTLRPGVWMRLTEDLDAKVRKIADREERGLAVVLRHLVQEAIEARDRDRNGEANHTPNKKQH